MQHRRTHEGEEVEEWRRTTEKKPKVGEKAPKECGLEKMRKSDLEKKKKKKNISGNRTKIGNIG